MPSGYGDLVRFCHCERKYLSSRAERGDLGRNLCHREPKYLSLRAQRKVPSGYGDLVRFCHCERSAAISPFLSKHPWGVASAAQSALRVWRSRLFRVGKQKREIASFFAMTNKRHAMTVRAGRQKREIASCLAMTDQLCHRERSAAISVVQGGQTQKREIASLARNDK